MLKTSRKELQSFENNITVSTETLASILDCGKATARKVGIAADAKVRIGKRVLWNVEKVKMYINTLS